MLRSFPHTAYITAVISSWPPLPFLEILPHKGQGQMDFCVCCNLLIEHCGSLCHTRIGEEEPTQNVCSIFETLRYATMK